MPLIITFIILLALLAFIYIGYPFLILFFSFFKKETIYSSDYQPDLSLIIACHKEED